LAIPPSYIFFWIGSLLFVPAFALLAQEITVKGKKKNQNQTSLSREELEKMPGTFGDPLRALETLPGVGVPSFFTGELVIRGAGPEANAYYFDELPIGYPFHLLGLNSVISKSMIQDISLQTGAYDARYQNALGGVVLLQDADFLEKSTRKMEVSLFSTAVSVRERTSNGSLTMAGRVSYLQETYGQTNFIPSGVQLPRYFNSQVKWVSNLSEIHRLSFYSLMSGDTLTVLAPTNEGERDVLLAGGRLANSRGFATHALRLDSKLGSDIQNRLTLIDFRPANRTNASLGTFDVNFRESQAYTGLRWDLEGKNPLLSQWEFGAEARALRYLGSGFTVVNTNPNQILPNPFDFSNPNFRNRNLEESSAGVYSSLYSSIRKKIQGITWNPGVRWENTSISGANEVSPRIRVDAPFFFPHWTHFWKLGRLHRNPQDLILAPNSGNSRLMMERVDSGGFGWNYENPNGSLVRVEIFANQFDRLIQTDPFQVLPGQQYFSNSGIGKSHGFEFLVRKLPRPNQKWYGWVSYTWSESLRRSEALSTFPNNDWRPFDFDQRHMMNVVLGYKWNEAWTVGLRWQYRSSFPITPILDDDGAGTRNPITRDRIFFPIFSSEINSGRLPDFHRLDIRIDRKVSYEWGNFEIFMEILNLYGRRNVVSQAWKHQSPFSEINPSTNLDLASFPFTQITTLPLFNFGLEVSF